MGSRDLGLPPLTRWPIGESFATVWVSWLLIGVPNGDFYYLPLHPPHLSPSHPTPLLSILTAERDVKKYHEIQPSEIKVIAML